MVLIYYSLPGSIPLASGGVGVRSVSCHHHLKLKNFLILKQAAPSIQYFLLRECSIFVLFNTLMVIHTQCPGGEGLVRLPKLQPRYLHDQPRVSGF